MAGISLNLQVMRVALSEQAICLREMPAMSVLPNQKQQFLWGALEARGRKPEVLQVAAMKVLQPVRAAWAIPSRGYAPRVSVSAREEALNFVQVRVLGQQRSVVTRHLYV